MPTESKSLETLCAWTDESGNSGQDLFDTQQPYFWTGTLLSSADLDVAGIVSHQEWLSTLGVKELHGYDLGITRIDQIASSVQAILESHLCKFIFALVDKEYHAAATLAKLLLDSDHNHAVSTQHDKIPLLSRMLLHQFLHFPKKRDLKQFWSSYAGADIAEFRKVLENLQLRIYENALDSRPRELLLDALGWAASHPDSILRGKRTDLDSPNLLALGFLLGGIHKKTEKTSRIIKFVHDEQDEFGRVIKDYFEKGKNAFASRTKPFGPFRLEHIEKFKCELSFSTSTSSIGLQLIDIVLYLVSRWVERKYSPRNDHCGALLHYVNASERCAFGQVTQQALEGNIAEEILQLKALPFNPEDETKARVLRDRDESLRKRRMGLPPN